MSTVVSLLVGACFVPNPDYRGVAIHGAGDGDGDGGSDGAGIGEGGGDNDDGGSFDFEPVDEHADPICGDGVVTPGERCAFGIRLLSVSNIRALAIADFDADGFNDLAVARLDDVLVLFGDGEGNFPQLRDLAEQDGEYLGVVAGDIDRDGDDDVIFSRNGREDVSMYRSNGDRSFIHGVEYETAAGPTAMVLSSFNRDNVLDLAVVCEPGDEIDVVLGLSDAMFKSAVPYPVDGAPVAIMVGLLDADVHLDLLVADRVARSVTLFTGLGEGSFVPGLGAPLMGEPRASVLADFDGDGALDVATTLVDINRVQLLFGDGLGGFFDSGQELATGAGPRGVGVGDFNSDGYPDLVVANHDDQTTGLLLGSPEAPGELMPHQVLSVLADAELPSAVVVGDLNDDGVDDLVVGGTGLWAMVSNP